MNGPTTWANVFYFAITAVDPPEDTVYNDLLTVVHDFYDVVIGMPNLVNEWHVFETRILIAHEDGSVSRKTVADAQSGTGGGIAEGAQMAYLVNFDTGDPRRGGKPRKYVSGVTDTNMLDSARLEPSFVTAASSNVGTWIEEVQATDTGLQLADISFRDSNAWRDTPLTYLISSGSMNSVVATQRRRVDRLR